MKLRASNPFRCHLFTLAALLAASFVHAASPIWSGTTSNLWSVGGIGGNWTDADAPIAGDTLNFAGSTNVSTNNDLTADTDFAGINFTNTGAGAGAFTLAGNRITLGGNITTTATALGSGGPLTVLDSISLDMILSGNRTITTNSAGTGATGMNHNLSVSGIISETGGARTLTKAGTGTLNLSGPNTYTGTTIISNSVLAISHNNALGATSGNTTIAATGFGTGPQLALSGNINSAENITITGLTEQNNGYGSVITNTSGSNTLSGNITLASPSGDIRLGSVGGELIFAGNVSQTGTTRTLVLLATTGAALTVNNAIANNNTGNLNILGSAGGGASNGVTLKAASTAIGNVNVLENGLLKLGVTNALKTTATLTLGVGYNFVGNGGFDFGKLDLAGFNQTVSALVGTKNSGNTIGADSNRIVTNSAASGTSTLTVGNSNGTGIFNGVILDGATAAVALTKIGTGTQTLVGNSNYSGVTTISAGTLVITHANALGSTAGNTTIASTGSASGLSLSNNINTAENITITGLTETGSFFSAIINNSGNNTLSGNITLSSPTGGIRLGATSGSLTFSGNISQTGTSQGLAFFANGGAMIVNNAIANNGGVLQVYGSSTVTLKGVNGAGGIGNSVVSQGGTLKLGVSEALKTTGNLDIGVGTALTADSGTFDLAGFNQTVNALSGIGTSVTNANRKVTNSAAGTGTNTLTVGNGNATGTFNGVILNGATAKIALTKTGTGTQTLAGVNTYSGNTTVNGGTLTLNNANASNQSSTVTIDASATLNLTYAGTDTVEKLFIGATQLAAGEYGNSSSVLPVIARSEITGTGTLTVTSGPSGGSNYSAWQTANSTTQTIEQDHDNDGVSNGVEFFISGPVATSGFTPLPSVINTSGTLSVTWTKASGYTGVYGIDFVVETSATLAAGSWTNEPNPGSTISFPTANEVKYTFPAGTKNFTRLKVTGP